MALWSHAVYADSIIMATFSEFSSNNMATIDEVSDVMNTKDEVGDIMNNTDEVA